MPDGQKDWAAEGLTHSRHSRSADEGGPVRPQGFGPARLQIENEWVYWLLRTKSADNHVELRLVMSQVCLSRTLHLLLKSVFLLSSCVVQHVLMQSTVLGGMNPGLEACTKVGNHHAPELMVVEPHGGSVPVAFGMLPVRDSRIGLWSLLPVF